LTKTPLSDRALRSWPEFSAHVSSRLEAGRGSYGDASFRKSLDALAGEVEEELLDVAGWSFILWTRVRGLRERLRELDAKVAP